MPHLLDSDIYIMANARAFGCKNGKVNQKVVLSC
jgi:hypothetical protein